MTQADFGTPKEQRHAHWQRTGFDNGWDMPQFPAWKRLPVIRHIRSLRASIAVARHDDFYRSMGLIPTGYDQWVIYGIWHGLTGRQG